VKARDHFLYLLGPVVTATQTHRKRAAGKKVAWAYKRVNAREMSGAVSARHTQNGILIRVFLRRARGFKSAAFPDQAHAEKFKQHLDPSLSSRTSGPTLPHLSG
jgi:hypothetical protein